MGLAPKKLVIPKKLLAFKTMGKSQICVSLVYTTFFCIIIYLNLILSVLITSQSSKTYENRFKMRSEQEHKDKAEEQIIPQSITTVHDNKQLEITIQDPFNPPMNISREERVAWFRQYLPRFDVLNEYPSSSQSFHSRVLEFLSRNECKVNLYMTWLNPEKSFGARQLMTIDSLFKENPRGCLVILSASLDSSHGYMVFKPWLDRGARILPVTPDLPFLVKNTPAEKWLKEMKTGTRDPGSIPLSQNLSNLIRLLMMYKYGGVYMDTDFIVLRDLSGLRNCVGAQSVDAVSKKWTRLNGAMMAFDVYHPLLRDFLEEFANTFDGNKWGNNGPYLVSRVVERVGSKNYNFTVLPVWSFYPVNWLSIYRLMKRPESESKAKWDERILREFRGKGTFAVHLWVKRSKDYVIEQGSVVSRLISEHCLLCNVISF